MNKTVWWIVGGVVGLGLIVLLAASIATEESVDASIGFGEVTVEGEPLPLLPDPTNDPNIGDSAPTIHGADWNGNEISIEADGRPKILIFLAHWCSHCQEEVPIVQQWVDQGNLPDEVDLYGITVSTDRLRPNWPPQDWLEAEGWTAPTIMDDEVGTISVSYGMRGTPFYAVLDGDNTNLQRVSGSIGTAGLDQLVQIALAG